ncbi:hypothetical protein PINS_up000488 [Pythium insidiosum]|nr:hypothetical protein PINS_up000488 [Pythium insidiosum]
MATESSGMDDPGESAGSSAAPSMASPPSPSQTTSVTQTSAMLLRQASALGNLLEDGSTSDNKKTTTSPSKAKAIGS